MLGLTTVQIIFLISIFLAVTAFSMALYFIFRPKTLSRRLSSAMGGGNELDLNEPSSPWIETVIAVSRPIAKLSLPSEGWETSSLRRKFIQAGLRSPAAPTIFFATKTALAFGLPFFIWLASISFGWKIPQSKLMLLMLIVMLVGFYAPNAFIDRLREERQKEIFESFPDALDLIIISMEAGLGMDQAITRVSREIRLQSTILADELDLYNLEVRAGAQRNVALRNLALRTGVEDIDSLVAMLIQSDRFGTSVGDALRVHSSTLRSKRQQRAEEAAAKIAVKLTLPLVLCIFPAILVVVAGPAMLQMGKIFAQIFGT